LNRGLQGFQEVHKSIQGLTRVCKRLHGLTRVYKGLQGFTRVWSTGNLMFHYRAQTIAKRALQMRTMRTKHALQGLLESIKKNGGSQAFFYKISISILQKKRRKEYFFTDFLKIRLYIKKSKHIYKAIIATELTCYQAPGDSE